VNTKRILNYLVKIMSGEPVVYPITAYLLEGVHEIRHPLTGEVMEYAYTSGEGTVNETSVYETKNGEMHSVGYLHDVTSAFDAARLDDPFQGALFHDESTLYKKTADWQKLVVDAADDESKDQLRMLVQRYNVVAAWGRRKAAQDLYQKARKEHPESPVTQMLLDEVLRFDRAYRVAELEASDTAKGLIYKKGGQS